MKKYDNSHATSPYMSWQVNEGTWVWMDCDPITSQLAGSHPSSVIDKIFLHNRSAGGGAAPRIPGSRLRWLQPGGALNGAAGRGHCHAAVRG